MRASLIVVALCVWTHAAAALESLEYFHGYFRGYLEVYARAGLPEDAVDQIAVVGDVQKPGTLPFSSGLTLSKALEAAGGFSLFADASHVGLWKNREGRFYTFDAYGLRNKQPIAKDPTLEKGDVVVVIQRHM